MICLFYVNQIKDLCKIYISLLWSFFKVNDTMEIKKTKLSNEVHLPRVAVKQILHIEM